MKVTSLFSSSSGNCILLEEKDTKILFDAGLSGKVIENELKKVSVDPKDIDAILLTHEHSDHIQGAGILSRRYDIPLYSEENTFLIGESRLQKIADKNRRTVKKDIPFSIKDIEFTPFSIPHDAKDPLGFMFDNAKAKGALSTDMGVIMDSVLTYLLKCDFLFLESNHDIDMLKTGPYPYILKKRILSPYGHLSNKDCATLCTSLVKQKATKIILGHLSKQNNTPQIALETTLTEAKNNGIKEGVDFTLQVANKSSFTPSVEF